MASTNDIRRLSRIVKLSYLQTVALVQGDKSTQEIVGSPSPFQQSFTSVSQPDFLFRLSLGIMGSSGGAKSIDFSDTGWTVSRTWLETYWDKVRYSIGIRELGIHRFNYVQTSEVISVPFSSPKDIEKVLVIADEIIPQEFPIGPRYIEYYISADPGTEWVQINPLDHPTHFGENGEVVPRIINFNTERPANATNENKYIQTDNQVRSVRFRAVLHRPEGIEGEEAMTPVLKGYRLLIYPRGGLG